MCRLLLGCGHWAHIEHPFTLSFPQHHTKYQLRDQQVWAGGRINGDRGDMETSGRNPTNPDTLSCGHCSRST